MWTDCIAAAYSKKFVLGDDDDYVWCDECLYYLFDAPCPAPKHQYWETNNCGIRTIDEQLIKDGAT